MQELALNDKMIQKIKMEVPEQIKKLMKDDLVEIIMYGSCARGDYTEDSDIDMALITKSDRIESQKYTGELAAIATDLAMKYFAVVNFVCLPCKEFMEKKIGMLTSKTLKKKEKYYMEQEYYNALAKVRIERAKELLEESLGLLEKEAYKSANNRAFYAIEKSIKSLSALKQTDAATHNGALKQFNFLFIYKGNGTFTSEDYQKIARAEQIRNISDYDDFYVASKEESTQQVENAKYIVDKVTEYIKNNA